MRGKGGGAKKGGASDASSDSNKNSVRTAQNASMNNATLASLRGEGQTSDGSSKPKPDRWGGAMSLGGRYFKKGVGAVVGTGLGAAGAMTGFAAGVAQGDVSAAFAGAIAGAKAGQGVSQRIQNVSVGNIKNSINEIRDTWNQGAYGATEAQNLKQIREFKSSSDYKALKDKYGDNFTDDKLRDMLQAGITDKGNMEKVLSSQNTGDAIGYYTLAQKCPDSVYYDDDKLQMYLEDLGLNQTDAKEMRKNMREFR